jgi:hypothetical protein
VCPPGAPEEGYEFRYGYAKSEKQIEGEDMEPSENTGIALPKRQAKSSGTEGINNYRRSPHGFPQAAARGFPSGRDKHSIVT